MATSEIVADPRPAPVLVAIEELSTTTDPELETLTYLYVVASIPRYPLKVRTPEEDTEIFAVAADIPIIPVEDSVMVDLTVSELELASFIVPSIWTGPEAVPVALTISIVDPSFTWMDPVEETVILAACGV